MFFVYMKEYWLWESILCIRWTYVLATLYWVETRVLKQAVRRNFYRFPDDFMFTLTKYEVDTMVSQSVIPSKQQMWWAQLFAFTEHGILMLANVLKSPQALSVSIQIIRYFIAMRKLVSLQDNVTQEIAQIREQISEHDELIQQLCFEIEKVKYEEEQPKRKIGFRTNWEK